MSSSPSTHVAIPLPAESLGIAAGAATPDDGWHALLLNMGRWAVARADVRWWCETPLRFWPKRSMPTRASSPN